MHDNKNITVLLDNLFAQLTHVDNRPLNKEVQNKEEL
jgi:hypothetical protein